MKLKGGTAYLNMKENILDNIFPSDNSIYIEGIYKSAVAAVKSGKVIIIYNCGGLLKDVPVLVLGCNIASNGNVALRVSATQSTPSYVNRTLYIKPDSTYFVTA